MVPVLVHTVVGAVVGSLAIRAIFPTNVRRPVARINDRVAMTAGHAETMVARATAAGARVRTEGADCILARAEVPAKSASAR